jgi:hypothetical protein
MCVGVVGGMIDILCEDGGLSLMRYQMCKLLQHCGQCDAAVPHLGWGVCLSTTSCKGLSCFPTTATMASSGSDLVQIWPRSGSELVQICQIWSRYGPDLDPLAVCRTRPGPRRGHSFSICYGSMTGWTQAENKVPTHPSNIQRHRKLQEGVSNLWRSVSVAVDVMTWFGGGDNCAGVGCDKCVGVGGETWCRLVGVPVVGWTAIWRQIY